ncbi:hypothetical protein G6N05_05370 [Flavobacterium sp. F372]|uniref:Terminase n=1 Tax=Flavobacterium bernardetii TaxID=2813823 RepID=A0ABR7J171_9FLAO|nr:hypothetical protein [Flavobacterium bernardetii]MBC5835810.1 hypothetical protein [Flavobacterium bernardetii]NHF69541.1 hypothetical protein [Flavobacterium bernardetii]
MAGELILRKKETTLDKIRKYYLKGPDKVTLSDNQEKIRLKLYKAWNLLCNYHSKEQAMNVLFNDGCSRAQAYRYVNDSMSVFGDVFKNQIEAKRYLIEEDLMRLQQRAIKNGDGDLELRVLAQRIKLGNFNKDNDINFDPEKLQAQTYIIKADPAALEIIRQRGDGGLFDFNMVDSENIPFQEVKEVDDDEE